MGMDHHCWKLLAVLAALLLAGCASRSTQPGPRATATQSAEPLARVVEPGRATQTMAAASAGASLLGTAVPTPPGMIRASALAGTWYPADAEALGQMVDSLLGAVKPAGGAPIALIVPHAGYAYSGPVAAAGFKQLEQGQYDVAVIIAADHQEPLSDPIAVWPDGAFETPLGQVPVDAELARALIAADSHIKNDPAAHQGEHPIEIELPFLQRMCPNCRIVPVLMGRDDDETVQALADALLKVLAGRRAVVIASSDLSHYPSYQDAITVDGATLSAIETGDPGLVRAAISASMDRHISQLATCACGEAAILVAMRVAQGLGADTTTILTYANSGDSPQGDKNQVVGYGAVMLWRYQPPALSQWQQQTLLKLARDAIAEQLNTGKVPASVPDDAGLARQAGAFVTLKQNGELRGCIGHMEGDRPLYDVVRQMAVAAATGDPRFPPLKPEDLGQIEIEISVLSPLHRITDTEQIEIGKDGLLISQGGQQGVFLPQVPVEQGWDRNQYLENLCVKAGLMPGCWRQNAALYTFTAEVFGEGKR